MPWHDGRSSGKAGDAGALCRRLVCCSAWTQPGGCRCPTGTRLIRAIHGAGAGKCSMGLARVAAWGARGVQRGLAAAWLNRSPPLRSRRGPCEETVKRALLIHAGNGSAPGAGRGGRSGAGALNTRPPRSLPNGAQGQAGGEPGPFPSRRLHASGLPTACAGAPSCTPWAAPVELGCWGQRAGLWPDGRGRVFPGRRGLL